jgi:hypothetical protein
MLQLIKMDIAAAEIAKLRSVRHYNGHPLEAEVVTDAIVALESANQESVNQEHEGQQHLTQEQK